MKLIEGCVKFHNKITDVRKLIFTNLQMYMLLFPVLILQLIIFLDEKLSIKHTHALI